MNATDMSGWHFGLEGEPELGFIEGTAYQPDDTPDHVDVPVTELERQIVELREHAERHLAARDESPSPELLAQWHEFLDIDPDLRGRDYTQPGRAT